jgi:hypothetical protein
LRRQHKQLDRLVIWESCLALLCCVAKQRLGRNIC